MTDVDASNAFVAQVKRVVCEVCDRKGWGGYLGDIYFDPDNRLDWWFEAVTRMRKNHSNRGRRTIHDVKYSVFEASLLKPHCREGHDLALLDYDQVGDLLYASGSQTICWPEP